MTNTIPRSALEEAIIESQVNPWDDDPAGDMIRDDYSGRYMYGDTCFGLAVMDIAWISVILLALKEFVDEDEVDVGELARTMRTDSMGLGYIAYFPGWSLA